MFELVYGNVMNDLVKLELLPNIPLHFVPRIRNCRQSPYALFTPILGLSLLLEAVGRLGL
ncbi:hypothetical protein BCR35DRAFT_328224 [Leucosporidium creatinivorum]|uniref:Uncharacterized protein n=1 Tax=Leucosporidium creatinivorum TaxID=106004 RepID=A0A1Y2G4A4_9BASI|nr:hypothetical protein BCR35DRAFT_328224 [Leucosporidium creatinivorum]